VSESRNGGNINGKPREGKTEKRKTQRRENRKYRKPREGKSEKKGDRKSHRTKVTLDHFISKYFYCYKLDLLQQEWIGKPSRWIRCLFAFLSLCKCLFQPFICVFVITVFPVLFICDNRFSGYAIYNNRFSGYACLPISIMPIKHVFFCVKWGAGFACWVWWGIPSLLTIKELVINCCYFIIIYFILSLQIF
jgi:hypothetical protein